MSGPDCEVCGEHFMSCNCQKSEAAISYEKEQTHVYNILRESIELNNLDRSLSLLACMTLAVGLAQQQGIPKKLLIDGMDEYWDKLAQDSGNQKL